MDKEKLASLLDECASKLYDYEYNSWYNANTTRTFDEWMTNDLIDKCHRAILELEETND